jgi:hypothetical protein
MSNPCNCADCGVSTAPRRRGEKWEFYMVREPVWKAAGPPPATFNTGEVDLFGLVPASPTEYFLCIGCLEARLGRTLTPGDFTDCPLNVPSPNDTPRLRSRKIGALGRHAGATVIPPVNERRKQ